MKQIVTGLLLPLLCCALLGGCAPQQLKANDIISGQIFDASPPPVHSSFRTGLYISYLDLAEMPLQTQQEGAQCAAKIAANALSIGCTDVFVQMRAFGDAMYDSACFPSASQTFAAQFHAQCGFAGQLLEALQALGIRVHAWVNPYRLYPYGDTQTLYGDISQISVRWQQGLYLRPDSEQAKQRVLCGVRELLELGFDGIHFDDYFYPTDDAQFDAAAYAAYCEAGGTDTLHEWRTAAVSDLVQRCYALVKEYGADKEFSISPDGSIERNVSVHCADVKTWCVQPGYIDFICPQLYYGFENETMPFADVCAQWSQLCGASAFMPVLSAYKIAAEDCWAGSGSGEWLHREDMLAEQTRYAAAQQSCIGVALYRYDSLFRPAREAQEAVMAEIGRLLEVTG